MHGVVSKVMGLYYTVYHDSTYTNCVLRGKLRQKFECDTEKFSNPVAVGDEVEITIADDGTGVIEEIVPRKNYFSRKEKGKHRKIDIIAANCDCVVVMQSFALPKLNLRFADRIAVRCGQQHIPLILCVNKYDLASKKDIEYIYNYYKNTDISIVMTSAKTGYNIDEFKNLLYNKTSVIVGYSGVGKTSILNTIYPHLDLRVGEVSASTGKGKHTTTNVTMIIVEEHTRIIDTPGLREFGIMDIEPHLVSKYFYEFEKYAARCAFKPCTHDHEPDCEVKRLVQKGVIYEERYISYINILYSLKDYYATMYS
ncbi:MAG TPA: ribosome small subunit-dependent GTPase A [Spirochaetota bacterium]|nr:ribosome small subunit-dependent GTPase A [Spirochaetota bacterium]HOM09112.1 ribosome small subunit-dependent GTPase A [Spirochaetota bacterium]HPP48939.1 ribosome small subunit-dependent GTPase A [Spirochaetota bacterium]